MLKTEKKRSVKGNYMYLKEDLKPLEKNGSG